MGHTGRAENKRIFQIQVLQKNILKDPGFFNRSIADNIRYGDLNKQFSLDQVIEAARFEMNPILMPLLMNSVITQAC